MFGFGVAVRVMVNTGASEGRRYRKAHAQGGVMVMNQGMGVGWFVRLRQFYGIVSPCYEDLRIPRHVSGLAHGQSSIRVRTRAMIWGWPMVRAPFRGSVALALAKAVPGSVL